LTAEGICSIARNVSLRRMGPGLRRDDGGEAYVA
jgi:hypothetical protein